MHAHMHMHTPVGTPACRWRRILTYWPTNHQVVLTARSRANEFEADRYSVETYGEAEALVGALMKL